MIFRIYNPILDHAQTRIIFDFKNINFFFDNDDDLHQNR